ncbi:Cell division protein FtsW [Bathymodiolus heckerae thiotrophic gill symbiont]|nr:Cell division protein FtsW [Bathymodiolus heckerae thiotrophic gill symbiont]
MDGGVRWIRMTEFWQIDLWVNDSAKVYQTKQALIGIARGDWTGVGLGNGIQKYTKLPEPHTDMIFSIIGEEIGIIGMLFVIFIFGFIVLKGFKIAKDALKHKRKYSSYVGFGICTWLSLQFSVNIAMNLGLIPPKGFPLPLISYGGSSMIFVLIALGILLRIDMENRCEYSKQKKYV